VTETSRELRRPVSLLIQKSADLKSHAHELLKTAHSGRHKTEAACVAQSNADKRNERRAAVRISSTVR
jgi:hypothetical protein